MHEEKDPDVKQGKTPATPAAPPADPRDWWAKIAIVGPPVTASLTALTVAVVGWLTQITIRAWQHQETMQAEIEQRTRLYSELMSRREESEAALRKDMSTAILKDFFESPAPTVDAESRISKQLLKLELLALNFGESLSLSPLFVELAKDIDRAGTTGTRALTLDPYANRLNSLARRVSGWQLSALQSGARVFRVEVPFERVAAGGDGTGEYHWPDDEVTSVSLSRSTGGGPSPDEDERKSSLSVHELGNVRHMFDMTFSRADYDRKTVRVKLEITNCGWVGPRRGEVGTLESRSTCARPLDAAGNLLDPTASLVTPPPFELDFFDFPMIDNTRLVEDLRFALVMQEFRPDQITVLGVYFPGLYSSQRDKPFLDVVIHQLQKHTRLDEGSARTAEPEEEGGAPSDATH